MFNHIFTYLRALFSTPLPTPPEPLPRVWTDDEISTALSMTANNCTLDHIADTLNRSESAVYQKLRKLQYKEPTNDN